MSLKEAGKTIVEAVPALVMPVIILGGIYGGICTATEAAVVAVIYALLVGAFLFRTLTPKIILDCLISSARFTACIFFMIGCTSTFTWLLASTGLAQAISGAILSTFTSKITILLMINIILLILGCFMDTLAIVLLMTPVLIPICAGIGVSPIHLGVILILNTCLGMITPPLGTNLLMSTQLCGMKSLTPSLKHAMMYVLAGLIVLALFTYCEPLALLLVS